MFRLSAPLIFLWAFGSAAPAGWTTLDSVPALTREGRGLLFKNTQGILSVIPLSPDIIRVRFSPDSAFGRDHSYAVVRNNFGDFKSGAVPGRDSSVITTPSLKIHLRHSPLRLEFLNARGESLDKDDAARGISYSGAAVRVCKRLRDDEQTYGFGEKVGRLNKRGRHLGGYSYVMWNDDAGAYELGSDPLYASVPFFMVLKEGRAHGIFFDNTFRSSFDVGRESPQRLSFGAEGGELNYYFINGPDPKSVIERYTALTGRMPLPPRWALGYHQCRYSYYPESKLRDLAKNFRERKIPCDALWLDIHYLYGYRPFTWDPERFPDPKKMTADLSAQGFRVVTILDPHPKVEKGYAPYDQGLAGGHFVKNPDGSVYRGDVWPSRDEKSPGPNAFPDFSRPATREWWGSLYKGLCDTGIAGIWTDMNEPAVFNTPAATMPLDLRHDNEGLPTGHREIHNVYGMQMSRATFEGLSKLRPNARPFVLTRATFAGGQRYAAVWSGDNVSNWGHLRLSIPLLLNFGLSGFPFVGADIGGFNDGATPELYTRWIQLGVFYPFMRTHTGLGNPDQEPWSYGPQNEAINRKAVELRYSLLPEIYNTMREASETGVPALRPLFLEFPDDPKTYSLDDQFMWGRNLLVAPVVREGQRERQVYLPAGTWYNFWTGEKTAGGENVKVAVTLESLPLYVREGAILFRQAPVQHTGQMKGNTVEVHVYPSEHSESSFYDDDGESLNFKKGQFLSRKFIQSRHAGRIVIAAEKISGSYKPEPRQMVVRLYADEDPRMLKVAGKEMKWSRDNVHFISFSMAENLGKFEISVENR